MQGSNLRPPPCQGARKNANSLGFSHVLRLNCQSTAKISPVPKRFAASLSFPVRQMAQAEMTEWNLQCPLGQDAQMGDGGARSEAVGNGRERSGTIQSALNETGASASSVSVNGYARGTGRNPVVSSRARPRR